MTQTERKYLIVTVLGVVAIVGWNVFCIQRDAVMFKVYAIINKQLKIKDDRVSHHFSSICLGILCTIFQTL
jgi:hypothetical protein